MSHARFALMILLTVAAAALTLGVGLLAARQGFAVEAGAVVILALAASLLLRAAGRP